MKNMQPLNCYTKQIVYTQILTQGQDTKTFFFQAKSAITEHIM